MKVKILPPTPKNIQFISDALQQDEVVGIPTETVYGLAGNSASTRALSRIFEAKDRPTFDPLIIHISAEKIRQIEDLESLQLVDLTQISPPLRKSLTRIIAELWPGPLTLVLPKHPQVPDLATSGLPTVAIRMPRHPVTQALLTECHCSLAAPSANRFGRISPTSAEAVAQELGDRIHWILEGGPCEIGLESTILAPLPSGEMQILRPGGTPKEKIQELLGIVPFCSPPTLSRGNTPEGTLAPLAPGMLESHYAPQKPLWLLPQSVLDLQPFYRTDLLNKIKKFPTTLPVGLLVFSGDLESSSKKLSQLLDRPTLARALSQKGDLSEAAQNLFAEMRWLDSTPVCGIFAEPCPSSLSLGYAIQDRLYRASRGHDSR